MERKGMEDAAGEARSWKIVHEEKSLYICSTEVKRAVVSYVIYSIKLSDLFSSSCSCPNPKPHELVCPKCFTPSPRPRCQSCSKGSSELIRLTSMTGLPAYMGCGVFGSQIVFAGGVKPHFSPVRDHCGSQFGPKTSRDIYVFETDPTVDPNPRIKKEGSFKKFLGRGSGEPLLVELEGKLYALFKDVVDAVSNPPRFQVFDPIVQEWSPLPNPPRDYSNPKTGHAIWGTTILVSNPDDAHHPNDPHDPVYGIDVAKKDPEWTIVEAPIIFSSSCTPDAFHGTGALLVEDDDDCFMFTYHERFNYSEIEVHLAPSGTRSCWETIEILNLEDINRLPRDFHTPNNYNFVYAGDRKILLIMANFNYRPPTEKLRFLVMTLELTRRTEGVGVKRGVKVIATRFFECNNLLSYKSETQKSYLIGSFVL